MADVDYHLMKRALLVHEEECGDTGFFHQEGDICFFALIDGLGHGKPAHQAALLADKFLEDNHGPDLVEIMQGLHKSLEGSRGAVAFLCRLNALDGTMQYLGVGNITLRVFGIRNVRLTSGDGIVGYTVPTMREKDFQLNWGDVVMLYSDGIRENFEEYDCPGLLVGSAEDVVNNVFESFYKGDDDGSCLVVRYG